MLKVWINLQFHCKIFPSTYAELILVLYIFYLKSQVGALICLNIQFLSTFVNAFHALICDHIKKHQWETDYLKFTRHFISTGKLSLDYISQWFPHVSQLLNTWITALKPLVDSSISQLTNNLSVFKQKMPCNAMLPCVPFHYFMSIYRLNNQLIIIRVTVIILCFPAFLCGTNTCKGL